MVAFFFCIGVRPLQLARNLPIQKKAAQLLQAPTQFNFFIMQKIKYQMNKKSLIHLQASNTINFYEKIYKRLYRMSH
jgi:hypothetical protein